jgi:predicted Zn-dependent protease
MKRILVFILCVAIIIALFLIFNRKACLLKLAFWKKAECVEKDVSVEEALQWLKFRKDADALAIFERILTKQPDNLDALWGKAEVFRRSRRHKEAEGIINAILKKEPKHIASLVSLAHIRYKEDKLNEAQGLINQALGENCLDKESQARAYVILSSINSKYALKGGLLSKIKYGTKIKSYILKAKELAPDLPEVHLALGTFYLLAPKIIGGSLEKAIEELEYTVKIAPDFTTANARLAQAYNKKGIQDKYNFYLKRAENLDPENEVLKEISIK